MVDTNRSVQKDKNLLPEKPSPGPTAKKLMGVADSFHEQGRLWRLLSVYFAPGTFLSLVAAFFMLIYSVDRQPVELRPAPSIVDVKEVPDDRFFAVADEVVGLLNSYHYSRADAQFNLAKTFLWEPALSQFIKNNESEVPKILSLRRSQFFDSTGFPKLPKRANEEFAVAVAGKLQTWIGAQEPTEELLQIKLTMITVPRNAINPWGIVVTSIHTGVPKIRGGQVLWPQ